MSSLGRHRRQRDADFSNGHLDLGRRGSSCRHRYGAQSKIGARATGADVDDHGLGSGVSRGAPPGAAQPISTVARAEPGTTGELVRVERGLSRSLSEPGQCMPQKTDAPGSPSPPCATPLHQRRFGPDREAGCIPRHRREFRQHFATKPYDISKRIPRARRVLRGRRQGPYCVASMLLTTDSRWLHPSGHPVKSTPGCSHFDNSCFSGGIGVVTLPKTDTYVI